MEKKKKWEWIQSIRGGASLLVVVFHMWLYIKVKYNVDSYFFDFFSTQFIDSGKFAVALFFLISGYLLPYSMINKTRKEFIKNRFYRLYPAYWFSILLATIFIGGYSAIQILGNITMFQLFLRIPDMVGAYWTLPIELMLYIGCLIALKHIYNIRFIDIIFVILLGIALLASFARYYYEVAVPVAIFILLIVSLLGYYIRLYKEKKIEKEDIRNRIILFFVILLPICVLAYNQDFGYNETWYRYTISYMLAVVTFIFVSVYQYHNKWLSQFGKISYSMYLTHGIVIAAFYKYDHFISNIYLVSIIMFTFILLIAILTYKTIEKPSVKLLKKIEKNDKFNSHNR